MAGLSTITLSACGTLGDTGAVKETNKLAIASESSHAHATEPNEAVAVAVSASNNDSELAGTAWQLVEIVSMDDQVDAPDERSLYTVTTTADSTVQIRGGCNRGTTAWASSAPGGIEFGQIAATQAMYPPEFAA